MRVPEDYEVGHLDDETETEMTRCKGRCSTWQSSPSNADALESSYSAAVQVTSERRLTSPALGMPHPDPAWNQIRMLRLFTQNWRLRALGPF